MAKFITTRTLSMYTNVFIKKAVDWSFNYLCDSLSIISWFYSCCKSHQWFEEIGAELFMVFFHYFNYLKRQRPSNSCFFGAICKRTEPPTKNWKTDGIDSISIFSSRVSTNILWFSNLEIIATENDNFRCVCRESRTT